MSLSDTVSKTLLLLITYGAITFVTVFLMLLFRKKQKPARQLSLKEVVQILRQFKRDYFPICQYLLSTHESLTFELSQKYGRIPETIANSMGIILMDDNPQFKQRVLRLESRIFAKFQVSDPKNFFDSVAKYKSEHKEVSALLSDIEHNLSLSCQGRSLSLEIALPGHVIMSTTFQVYKTVVYQVLLALNTHLQGLLQTQEMMNTYDQDFTKNLMDTIKASEIRRSVLHKHQFDSHAEYHENHLLSAAIDQFSKQDEAFVHMISIIDGLNNELLQKHLKPAQDLEALRKQIDQIQRLSLNEPEGGSESLTRRYSSFKRNTNIIHDIHIDKEGVDSKGTGLLDPTLQSRSSMMISSGEGGKVQKRSQTSLANGL